MRTISVIMLLALFSCSPKKNAENGQTDQSIIERLAANYVEKNYGKGIEFTIADLHQAKNARYGYLCTEEVEKMNLDIFATSQEFRTLEPYKYKKLQDAIEQKKQDPSNWRYKKVRYDIINKKTNKAITMYAYIALDNSESYTVRFQDEGLFEKAYSKRKSGWNY